MRLFCFESVAPILNFKEAGMLMTRCIGGMEGEEQATVRRAEQHTVSTVLGVKRRHMNKICSLVLERYMKGPSVT